MEAAEKRASSAEASAREDLERVARDTEADRLQLEKRMADFRHELTGAAVPACVMSRSTAAICLQISPSGRAPLSI